MLLLSSYTLSSPMFLFLLILFNAVINTSAQTFLKVGTQRHTLASLEPIQWFVTLISEVYIWGGVICYGLSLLLWLIVLTLSEFTYAVLLLMTLTYILTCLVGITIFGETLTWLRTMGLILIILGVFCVAQSPSTS